MTDGTESVTDHHLSAENKALVERFANQVLVRGDMTALLDFFDGDRLIQHSPDYGDGVGVLQDQLARWRASERTFDRVHKLLGEGNMVLTIGEGRIGDQPTAFYDLYRVADCKIAEHWEVIESIPPRDQWQNNNGKF